MNLKFDISEQEVAKLDALLKDTGLESYRDLFNESLTLFKWAVKEVQEGRIVGSIDEAAQKYSDIKMNSFVYIEQNRIVETKQETTTSVSA